MRAVLKKVLELYCYRLMRSRLTAQAMKNRQR